MSMCIYVYVRVCVCVSTFPEGYPRTCMPEKAPTMFMKPREPRATFDVFDVGEFDLSIYLSRTLARDVEIRRN